MPSAADAAQKWAQNFGASGTRWAAGVQGVAVAPGALAARAKDRYATGTANAVDRFAANSAKVTREQWIEITVSKGQGRLASGAQAALPKTEQAFTRVFGWIDQTVRSLPPRGDIEANIARSAAFARGMNKLKMQGG
jgi:hypothetical protein